MNDNVPTKICSSCGQRKPLSAFLQMNASGTARHGQICATCRKTEAENAARRRKTEAEGGGMHETGHKIDTKARMQGERDKREEQASVHEDYHQERKLDDIENKLTQEKSEQRLKTEKKHHDSFLNRRSFLNEKKQTPTTSTAEEIQQTNQEAAQEERKKTQHDFSVPYHDPQIAGQLRFQSASFQAFRKRLGKDSPLVRAADQASKHASKETSATLEEHIDHTFGPKSKR